MYGIREIGVKFKDGNRIPGFERSVVGDENVLTAMAATDGIGDEAATFISLEQAGFTRRRKRSGNFIVGLSLKGPFADDAGEAD